MIFMAFQSEQEKIDGKRRPHEVVPPPSWEAPVEEELPPVVPPRAPEIPHHRDAESGF